MTKRITITLTEDQAYMMKMMVEYFLEHQKVTQSEFGFVNRLHNKLCNYLFGSDLPE